MTLEEYRKRLAGTRICEIDHSFYAGNDSDKDCVLQGVISLDEDGSGWVTWRVTHKGVCVYDGGAFSTATRRYHEIVHGDNA